MVVSVSNGMGTINIVFWYLDPQFFLANIFNHTVLCCCWNMVKDGCGIVRMFVYYIVLVHPLILRDPMFVFFSLLCNVFFAWHISLGFFFCNSYWACTLFRFLYILSKTKYITLIFILSSNIYKFRDYFKTSEAVI